MRCCALCYFFIFFGLHTCILACLLARLKAEHFFFFFSFSGLHFHHYITPSLGTLEDKGEVMDNIDNIDMNKSMIVGYLPRYICISICVSIYCRPSV